jgi:trafficking protein particle complex subunit 11
LPKWHYDLSKSLEGLSIDSKPVIAASDDTLSSFVSASFVFKSDEGKAGQTCQAQLSIMSNAFPESAPITVDSITVNFEGSIKAITLQHETSSERDVSKGNILLSSVPLQEESISDDIRDNDNMSVLHGKADLTLKPGQTRVFEMAIPLREPGDARAAKVVLSLDKETFALNYAIGFKETSKADVWYGPRSFRKTIARLDAHSIHVQPRPPKMEIKLAGQLDQYYANEPIQLPFDILNSEDTEAVAKVEIILYGEQIPAFRVGVADGDAKQAEATAEESQLSGIPLANMGSSQSVGVVLSLDAATNPCVIDVTVKVSYHLVSDPATPILQTTTLPLNIVNAFEANYDLVPRLHADPWPSLFDYDGLQYLTGDDAIAQPRGVAQKWCLVCHYASFASEDLEIVDMDAKVLGCFGGARCLTTSRPRIPDGGLKTPPRTVQEAQFDLVAQKLSLDDRGPASLDVAFVIKWKRTSSDTSPVNTTTMVVPRHVVLGMEPRVLASISHVNPATGLIHFDVTIENASSHFLTFGLTMEPSDEFAFSGAKQTTVHVLPVSRRTVTYRLLPLVRATFLRPALSVRDKYFQKVLRIIPTEGMKIDKEGLLVWIPPGEDNI